MRPGATANTPSITTTLVMAILALAKISEQISPSSVDVPGQASQAPRARPADAEPWNSSHSSCGGRRLGFGFDAFRDPRIFKLRRHSDDFVQSPQSFWFCVHVANVTSGRFDGVDVTLEVAERGVAGAEGRDAIPRQGPQFRKRGNTASTCRITAPSVSRECWFSCRPVS